MHFHSFHPLSVRVHCVHVEKKRQKENWCLCGRKMTSAVFSRTHSHIHSVHLCSVCHRPRPQTALTIIPLRPRWRQALQNATHKGQKMIAGMWLAPPGKPGCYAAARLSEKLIFTHTSQEDVVTPVWQDWSVICHMSLKLEADQMKV